MPHLTCQWHMLLCKTCRDDVLVWHVKEPAFHVFYSRFDIVFCGAVGKQWIIFNFAQLYFFLEQVNLFRNSIIDVFVNQDEFVSLKVRWPR